MKLSTRFQYRGYWLLALLLDAVVVVVVVIVVVALRAKLTMLDTLQKT